MLTEVDGHEEAYPCTCREQQRLARLFRASGIGPALRSKTFDSFTTDGRHVDVVAMRDCAADWHARLAELAPDNWLLLLGTPGSGKTHLALACAVMLLDAGASVLYWPYLEGLEELKASMATDGLAARLDAMKKADVLVIDDLYKGRDIPTEWALERMFEVLNDRYLQLRPTIISSERLPHELLRVDHALGSRLLERARGHVAVVTDKDANYRLR